MLARAPAPVGEGIEHEEEDGLLVKVIDFGLAKNVGGNETGGGLTGGNVVGTPYFMSPEQISIESGSTLDCRSDIYSLGVTLWYLLLGRPPFEGSQFQILSQHLQKRPPLEKLSQSGVPTGIVALIGSMLAKDREERPANHPALIAALKKLLRTGGSATTAPGREDSSREESPDGTMAMPPVATDKRTSSTQQASAATRADEEFSIAVLPFKSSGGAKMEAFANGLGQDITTGLSRFRYISVVAKASATQLKTPGGDERAQSARYLLDGSIRQAGSTIRVTAQLIDAQNDAQLWAETYDRDPKVSGIFAVQDDVAARIVATAADSYGVLVHAMASVLRQRDDADFPPVAWQFQYFAYREQIGPAAHAALRSRIERAVERDDRQSDVWACLALIYTDEYAFGFGVDATSLDRALAAARRAVELDRANQFALVALAQVHFFRQDLAAFGPAAERAMALNPLNTDALGILGLQIVHTGEFERGTAIVRRAMELNANHAGWMHFAPLWEHFHKGEYEQALERANRVDVPGLFWPYLVMASACGHLGRRAEAAAAVRDLLALDPEFAAHARGNVGTWHFASGLMDPILEGLRKAGLSIPAADGSPGSAKPTGTVRGKTERSSPTASGPVRADEGFWVAVLPFKYGGTDASLTALADGLTEEIVTGLSRFSYLRVISRSATVDSRSAGKELGARYVMEGSLRQAGTKLRLAVQLVDALSGAHLWAENYERSFSPDTVFELQDELVPRIVSTVADMHGVLPRSMSELVRSRPPEQLSPYEAVLRSFGYFDRVTAEDLAAARAGLESAVRKAPAYADAWAMLALLCAQEYGQGFNLQADPLGSASTAARRAVEIAPSNHLAHFALAQVFFFQKEFQSLRNTAERVVALNPMDGNSIAFLGEVLIYSGDLDRGLALAERAKQLNPNHPGWYWYADTYNAFRQGDDRGALNFVLKANLPGHWGSQAMMAAAHGHLGEHDAAARAVRELLRIRPDFAATVRGELAKWFDPIYGARLIDGLRKAGLEIPDERNPSARADATAVAIAVLPFADLSEAKDQAYLCEGMAEEIMNALVQIDGIRVASRTSAFRAKQNHIDLPAIARALSVGHVLEGSVRTSGNRLRVTAQLTDVASGFQLWSERFDREAADIFAVQDEIAAGVMEAVKARLAPGQKSIQPRPRVKNLEAYRIYLKGRHLRGKEHHDGALRAFEEAVRLDPSHAPSWTGLAEVTVLASVFGVIPAREACATARKALDTARGLQGESADGLHVEAFVAWIERRWAVMEAAWNRAIQLQPNHVLALASFGLVLCTRQRLDEGLQFLERARQADPLASFPYSLTGGGLLHCGRPQDGLRYLEDALSFESEDATALDNAGIAKVALGRFEEGIAMLEHVVAVSHRGAHFLGTLGWALATAGRKSEAWTILDELRARPPGAPTIVSEVWLLGALGELDAAFEVVARAEEECMAYLYFTGMPGFDSLRADPRFAALEKRLGLKG